MARPIKIGLDYFPMDTTWDIKMRLLKARYKLEGVGLIVELYQAIYREGYALIWNEDSRLLIADETGISIERLDEIVGFAAAKDIFDSETLKKGYLTSHGIQARWVKACTETKRKENKIPPDIDLLQHATEFTPEETHAKPEETQSNTEFSTQSKVNKRKGNKIDNIEPRAATRKPSKIFTPPTLLEVGEYCRANGYTVNPETFIKFYSESDPPWHDSNGKAVKNWKQKIISTWSKNNKGDRRQPVHSGATLDMREA